MIIANRKIQMNNLEKFVYKHSSEFKFNDNGINYCFKYEWTCWKLINETTGGLLAEGEGYIENGSLDPLNPNCSKENMIKWVLDQGIYLYEGELEPSIKDKIIRKLAEQVKKEVVFYDSDGISSCDLSKEEHEKCTKHNNGANCIDCIINWAKEEVIKND